MRGMGEAKEGREVRAEGERAKRQSTIEIAV